MNASPTLISLDGAAVRYPRQGMLAVFRPEGDVSGVVLAVHGSGRGIDDYSRTPFYLKQRDISLENGHAFAVLENGPDTYGTDEGLFDLTLAAEELFGLFRTDRIVLWATSAGGVCALRYAAGHREHVSAFIGTFPVADLNSVFPILQSCRRAWDAEGLTPEGFAEKIKGKNPPDLTDSLRGLPMFIAHGLEDRAVPYHENAGLLVRIGAKIHTVPDGVHGTEDYRYYEHAPYAAFDYLKHEK